MNQQTVSVLVPVMNETDALRQTVHILVGENRPYLCEIIILLSKKSTQESVTVAHALQEEYSDLVRLHVQAKPFIGGAFTEGFALARGTYTLMMASDLETDPHTVKEMIATMTKGSCDIVTTTRWKNGKRFEGYNGIKLVFNYFFQQWLRVLYWTTLTDMTFAFRLYKTPVLTSIVWNESRHPFLLETLVKPLRFGVPCV